MAENAHGAEPGQNAPQLPLPDVAALGVGEALRRRREQLGWSVHDVATWLRIRDVYIDALETGKSSVLPAEVYTLGFLRTYAQALGFDASVLVGRYRQESRNTIHKPVLDFPDPPPDRRLTPAVSISLGLAVVVASYVGWYYFVGHTPPVPEHVPSVASLMPGETGHNAPSPQVASILPEKAGPQPLPKPEIPAPLVATEAEAPAVVGAGPAAPSFVQPGPVPAEVTPSADVPPPAPVGQDAQIVLKAQGTSWVQVKDGQGKVVYDHVLHAGDDWSVPADNGPYSLTVGNAGGVVLVADGLTTQPLGRNGAVRRNIALTAQTVRDGSVGGGQDAPVLVKTKADASVPDVAAAVPSANGQSGSVKPRQPARADKAPKQPEPSADDLNARQLRGMGAQ